MAYHEALDSILLFLDINLVAVYDLSVTGVDHNLPRIVVSCLLILNNDLVFAWLHVACEDEHIIFAFPLSLVYLSLGQTLASLDLVRYC